MENELENYILEHISEEDEVLKELARETYVKVFHPRQLSGHLQGKILEMISKMINPKHILELGTFTGYSAICLAKGLQDDGKLITIEVNDEIETIFKKYLEKSGLPDKIIQKIGDAIDIIPEIDMNFDLVFIDANKKSYIDYYNLVFDKVNKGGFIIADNILWDGKVLSKPKQGDHFTKGIQEFNNYIKNDKRVEKVIFPVRDGMLVIRKM